MGGDQHRRQLLEPALGGVRLAAHPRRRVRQRGDRLDQRLARQPIVLRRRVGAQRDAGEGVDLLQQPTRQPRRLGEFPARPEVAEEMGDRRADQRVGEAGDRRRRLGRVDEMQRDQRHHRGADRGEAVVGADETVGQRQRRALDQHQRADRQMADEQRSDDAADQRADDAVVAPLRASSRSWRA